MKVWSLGGPQGQRWMFLDWDVWADLQALFLFFVFFPPKTLLNLLSHFLSEFQLELRVRDRSTICLTLSESERHSVVSDSLIPWTIHSMGFSRPTGVVSLCLLQGIFPTQESNRGLLPCRRILYQLTMREAPLSRES